MGCKITLCTHYSEQCEQSINIGFTKQYYRMKAFYLEPNTTLLITGMEVSFITKWGNHNYYMSELLRPLKKTRVKPYWPYCGPL